MNNSFCYDARSQHFTFNLFKISQSSSTLSPKKSNYNWIELDAVDSTNNYAMRQVHAGAMRGQRPDRQRRGEADHHQEVDGRVEEDDRGQAGGEQLAESVGREQGRARAAPRPAIEVRVPEGRPQARSRRACTFRVRR